MPRKESSPKKKGSSRKPAVSDFRELADSIGEPFSALDRDLRYTYWNKACEEDSGIPAKNALGRNLVGLFPELKGSLIERTYRKVLNSGKPETILFETPRGDALRSYEITVYPSRTGISVVTRDISKRMLVERSLHEAERRFQNLLARVNLVAVMLDTDGLITFCNDFLLDLTGWRAEEVIGRPWFKIFVRDTEAERVFAEAVDKGAIPGQYENAVLTRSGEKRIIQWSNTVLHDLTGRVTGTASIGGDITERKRSEEKSKEYSSNLERLLTISREMTSTKDIGKLYRVVVKTAIDLLKFDFSTVMILSEDRTGLTVKDCIGFPASMIGKFSLVEGQGLSTYVVKNKRSDSVVDFNEEQRFEVPPVVRQNKIRSALCVPMMLEDEVFGALIGHTLERRSFSRDEVELYQSIGNQAAVAVKNAVNMDALRRSEKKLRDITSHIAEGLYVIDPAGRITFMNEEGERLLGWSVDELNEKGAHQLVHFQRPDGTPLSADECHMHKVISTGERFTSDDEVFVRKDGTVFPVSVASSPIVEDGRIVASVTAFRDITETKRLELALLNAQKLDSIGILAGGIAHDFNNLLTSIMGNISLSRLQIKADGRVSRLMAEAEKACIQAKDLSYRLLTFSKGGEPMKQVLSVSALLRDAVNLSLSGSNVTSTFNLPEDLPPAEADEGQMRQVVNNLVLNAREAMPAGGVLSISAEKIAVNAEAGLSLKPGVYARITFADQGIGIAPENLPNIFDPYFSTKDMGSAKGRGLGLAICHSIIRKHDGLITVESEVGKGTAFNIFLPLGGSGSPNRVLTDAATTAASKARVLVMDDEERVRKIVGEILEFLDYDAECVREGGEAVSAYIRARDSGAPFDLVFLDLTVPGGAGGLDTLAKLKELDPSVRAIVSTGYADDPIMKDYKNYGFVGAIAKPYDVPLLDLTLKQALDMPEPSRPHLPGVDDFS